MLVVVIIIIAGVWIWWMHMSPSNPSGANTASTGQTTNAAGTNANTNGGSQTNSGATGNGTTTGPFAQPTLSVNTSNGDAMGYHLVATNGMTLYEYDKDTAGVSNCTGACATTWPPYTVTPEEASSSLTGGAGVNGKIGVITRADGSLQVTYDNIPLYFYAKDTIAGDANGQGVGGFTTIAP